MLPRSVWSDKALKLPCPHLTVCTIQLIMFHMRTCTHLTLSLSHIASVCVSNYLSLSHTKNSEHFKGPFLHTVMLDTFERGDSLVSITMTMNYQQKSSVSVGFHEVKLSVRSDYRCEDSPSLPFKFSFGIHANKLIF